MLAGVAIIAAVLLYVLACQRGILHFRWSYSTPLAPHAAYERFTTLLTRSSQRAGIQVLPSPDEAGVKQLLADGRLVAETHGFETEGEHAGGQWERPVARSGRKGNWYWAYFDAVPTVKGSRFSYMIGPNAPLTTYLLAMALTVPRLWFAMRPKSLKVTTPLRDDFHNDLMTSLIACMSFIALWGVEYAAMIIPIILIHELGHVVGYRLTGKVGNRMMLVPFFGGIAIAGSDHRSEAERAFCAIMGPAICVPVSIILALVATNSDGMIGYYAYYAAWICAFINAANLLPALPLDGGHSLESLLRSLAPTQAGYAMLTLTGAIALMLISSGYTTFAFIIVLWGFPAIMRSFQSPVHLKPMNFGAGVAIAAFHLVTASLHIGTMIYLSPGSFI